MRPKSEVWDHFVVLRTFHGKPLRVACNCCKLERVANSTKMMWHLQQQHPVTLTEDHAPSADDATQCPLSPPEADPVPQCDTEPVDSSQSVDGFSHCDAS